MWGVGVNTSVSNNEQVSNVYNESQKYTDQSVKDTMIQNYITNITTRSEDVTDLVKNFTNNVSAEADSVQQNKTKFGACIDLDGANIVQSNELIQDVTQGFEKLNEDAKILKKVIDSQSEGEVQSGQGSTSNQGASASTDQSANQNQGSVQETEQKAGFTALNAYNKIMMRERFGMQKLNPFANLVKKDEKKSIREHFESWLYPREKFCLFGCVDVNTSVSNNSQTSNSTNIDLQANIQTQDIYKKIDTAYDKTVETITKISETINETTNSIASASSIQINEFIIETPADACKLNLKNLTLDQRNKLEQNVELTTAIQNINTLTNDTEVKAIMSDMMGLTQASETTQDSKTDTKQKSDQTQTNEQKTTQTSGGGSWVMIIIILIIVAVGFMAFKAYTTKDGYFDGNPLPKITNKIQQSGITHNNLN